MIPTAIAYTVYPYVCIARLNFFMAFKARMRLLSFDFLFVVNGGLVVTHNLAFLPCNRRIWRKYVSRLYEFSAVFVGFLLDRHRIPPALSVARGHLIKYS